MLHHGIRVAVAILTFSIGVAIFWPLQLIQRLETALVDRFYGISDLRPVSVTFDSATDANEIYRLLIHKQIKSNDEIKLVVLLSETTSFPMCWKDSLNKEMNVADEFHKMVNDLMPEAQFQTLDDYLLRNETPDHLKVWNLGINYVLVNANDIEGPGNYWDRFYKKFPDSPGFIAFSKVGFNNQHDQAFVYVTRGCGELCGGAEFVLLKKVNGKWEIVNEQVQWVS